LSDGWFTLPNGAAIPGCLEITRDLVADSIAHLLVDLSLVQQQKQSLYNNDATADKLAGEDQILFAGGRVLGDGQVMRLETQSPDSFGLAGTLDDPV
jgi:hypothetical protein